ncbi:hypothetical protein CF319_g5291 [Tilletia indica]|nr:hypothetical protein CF319_g5291 [Tilletia indica]
MTSSSPAHAQQTFSPRPVLSSSSFASRTHQPAIQRSYNHASALTAPNIQPHLCSVGLPQLSSSHHSLFSSTPVRNSSLASGTSSTRWNTGSSTGHFNGGSSEEVHGHQEGSHNYTAQGRSVSPFSQRLHRQGSPARRRLYYEDDDEEAGEGLTAEHEEEDMDDEEVYMDDEEGDPEDGNSSDLRRNVSEMLDDEDNWETDTESESQSQQSNQSSVSASGTSTGSRCRGWKIRALLKGMHDSNVLDPNLSGQERDKIWTKVTKDINEQRAVQVFCGQRTDTACRHAWARVFKAHCADQKISSIATGTNEKEDEWQQILDNLAALWNDIRDRTKKGNGRAKGPAAASVEQRDQDLQNLTKPRTTTEKWTKTSSIPQKRNEDLGPHRRLSSS